MPGDAKIRVRNKATGKTAEIPVKVWEEYQGHDDGDWELDSDVPDQPSFLAYSPPMQDTMPEPTADEAAAGHAAPDPAEPLISKAEKTFDKKTQQLVNVVVGDEVLESVPLGDAERMVAAIDGARIEYPGHDRFSAKEAAGYGALDAASFGFDRLAAGMTPESLLSMHTGQAGLPMTPPADFSAAPEDPRMAERGVGATATVERNPAFDDEASQSYQADQFAAQREEPGAYMAGAGGAGLATSAPLAIPGAAVTRSILQSGAPNIGRHVLAGMVGGAASGGLEGIPRGISEAAMNAETPTEAMNVMAGSVGTNALMGGAFSPVSDALGFVGRGSQRILRGGPGKGQLLNTLEEGGGGTTMALGGIRDVPAEVARRQERAAKNISLEGYEKSLIDTPLGDSMRPGAPPRPSPFGEPDIPTQEAGAELLAKTALHHLDADQKAMRNTIAQENKAFYSSPEGQQRASARPVIDAIDRQIAKYTGPDGEALPFAHKEALEKARDSLWETRPDEVAMFGDEMVRVDELQRQVDTWKTHIDDLEAVILTERKNIASGRHPSAKGGMRRRRRSAKVGNMELSRGARRMMAQIKNLKVLVSKAENAIDAVPRSPRNLDAESLDQILRDIDVAAGMESASGKKDSTLKQLGRELRRYRANVWGDEWAARKQAQSLQIAHHDIDKSAFGVHGNSGEVPRAEDPDVVKKVKNYILKNHENKDLFNYIERIDKYPEHEQPEWWMAMREMAQNQPGQRFFETAEKYAERAGQGPAEFKLKEMRASQAASRLTGSGDVRDYGTKAGQLGHAVYMADPIFGLVTALGKPAPGAAATRTLATAAREHAGSPAEEAQAEVDALPPGAIEFLRYWRGQQKKERRER